MDLDLPSILSLSLWVVTTIVMIVNFVSYTWIRELKNRHNLEIRCYISTYVVPSHVYFGVLFLNNIYSAEIARRAIARTGGIVIHYFIISSALWLQVISSDVWWTFWNVRNVDHRLRRSRNKKCGWYSMYALLIPGFLVVPEIIGLYEWSHATSTAEQEAYEISKEDLRLRFYIDTGVYTTVFLCNVSFYISMVCVMRRQKKDTNALTEGSNRRYGGVQKQWFNLYVKLFFLMDFHMVTWTFIPFELIGDPLPSWSDWVCKVIELIHSISIFGCFVWKDSVKKALRERFRRIVSRSGEARPDSRNAVDSFRLEVLQGSGSG